MSRIETEVADLEAMSSPALREAWVRLTATPVPRISPRLLRLALAWEIQARKLGGLSRSTTRNLDQLARLSGVKHRGWRKRAQHASNASSVQIGHGGMRERPPITLRIRRAALGLDRTALIEDILVPLRRQFPIAS